MKEDKQRVVQFLTNYGMDYTQVDMESCSRLYIQEMTEGLAAPGKSSLEMIPTFLETLKELPKNKRVIAMDAGGTNFRIASVHFDDSGKPVIENFNSYTMPGLERELKAEEFFQQLGDALDGYLAVSERIGFCFSYPLEMLRNHDGRLIRFTKEIRAKEVEGLFIGKELNAALSRKTNSRDKQIVLLNDTVASLLAGMSAAKEKKYDSYIGFILGTGMNCSYIEANECILKEPDLSPGTSQIINIESGGFGKAPRGTLDLLFDEHTDYPGKYTYEKMISGGYLGQMILTVLKQAYRDGLLEGTCGDYISRCSALSTQEVNEFLLSPTGNNTISRWIPPGEEQDRAIIYMLLMRLIERAGKFAAITLSSIIRKTGKGRNPCYPVCITAEGTTFYRMKYLKQAIQFYMKQFLVDSAGMYFEFVNVENAPLVGAAIAGLLTG